MGLNGEWEHGVKRTVGLDANVEHQSRLRRQEE